MGKLVEGKWVDQWYDTTSTGGRFVREDSGFRGDIARDEFEPGRYHLYVSLACPWAHRALIFRKLKHLEDKIGLSIVDPLMAEHGWAFSEGPGCIPDTVNDAKYLHQLYTLVKRDYTGRVTVPVLWDKRERTIVNNESSEIIRIFNRIGDGPDYYPERLRPEIDEVNALVYERINNGVYKAGFATEQAVYEQACRALFEALDTLEARLATKTYLCGDAITEADWRLFTTLLRFDPVYHGHFKCNLKRLIDYPNLSRYAEALHAVPGIADTTNYDHNKQHYYRSHKAINPTGIVPLGPSAVL